MKYLQIEENRLKNPSELFSIYLKKERRKKKILLNHIHHSCIKVVIPVVSNKDERKNKTNYCTSRLNLSKGLSLKAVCISHNYRFIMHVYYMLINIYLALCGTGHVRKSSSYLSSEQSLSALKINIQNTDCSRVWTLTCQHEVCNYVSHQADHR